ncbi:MAG: prepilin-type N-terminal cleavage/methylation domain-containing protein [bacterium]|nr:prepilin-type N-terminal cleavage/methylation domain-containing protein [bacterium]
MKSQRGFTLTEIIVAIAVITILAGAMTPLIFKQIDRSRKARAGQDLDAVKSAFLQYYADTQHWPCDWDAQADKSRHADLTDFTCLYSDDGLAGWDGPYVNESGGKKKGKEVAAVKSKQGDWSGIVDPWGQPYRFFEANTKTKNAKTGAVVLYSAGKNGSADTKDKDLVVGKAKEDDVVLLISRRAKG